MSHQLGWQFYQHQRHRHYLGQVYPIRLTSARRPNPAMTVPEARFTHFSAPWLSLDRKWLVPALNRSHHVAEPVNTPNTNSPADA